MLQNFPKTLKRKILTVIFQSKFANTNNKLVLTCAWLSELMRSNTKNQYYDQIIGGNAFDIKVLNKLVAKGYIYAYVTGKTTNHFKCTNE